MREIPRFTAGSDDSQSREIHRGFALIPADAPGEASWDPTVFALRVYETVRRIPRGRVSTYGRVAAMIGCGSPRAVGSALRRNPFAPEVPCHRVIASSLSPGGYQGFWSGAAVQRKLDRLAAEGVRFEHGRLAEPDRLWPSD
ncbi:MAG: MGMT family protein [Kiritimatiellia bacterium]|nr:MGMT family protein [Kiritimatiellia bacterium]